MMVNIAENWGFVKGWDDPPNLPVIRRGRLLLRRCFGVSYLKTTP